MNRVRVVVAPLLNLIDISRTKMSVPVNRHHSKEQMFKTESIIYVGTMGLPTLTNLAVSFLRGFL